MAATDPKFKGGDSWHWNERDLKSDLDARLSAVFGNMTLVDETGTKVRRDGVLFFSFFFGVVLRSTHGTHSRNNTLCNNTDRHSCARRVRLATARFC